MFSRQSLLAFLACLIVSQSDGRSEMIGSFDAFEQVAVTGSPVGSRSAFENVADSGSIGGYRGLLVTRTSDRGSISADVNDSITGALTYNSGVGAAGFLEIHYDGNNASSVLDPSGLGGIDLTASGLNTGFRFRATSDLGATLTFEVVSGAGNLSVASVAVQADPTFTFHDYILPFSVFSPAAGYSAADFTHAGAISIVIDGRLHPGVDIALEPIQLAAVPEPSTLALSGTGGVCLLLALRRRRSQRGEMVV